MEDHHENLNDTERRELTAPKRQVTEEIGRKSRGIQLLSSPKRNA